ncbi:MAG TPA: hypothetical protein VFZ97_18660 [Acidimicrobiales bacterium]
MGGSMEDDDPRRQGGLDPVPEGAIKRARDAFSQRASGPVAELVSDSLVERGDPAGAHLLKFKTGATTIDLQVSVGASDTILRGTVHGSEFARAVLHLEGSEVALVKAVADGSFGFDGIAHGVVRLSFESGGEPTLWSDWFQV